jgi:hypothetical protein
VSFGLAAPPLDHISTTPMAAACVVALSWVMRVREQLGTRKRHDLWIVASDVRRPRRYDRAPRVGSGCLPGSRSDAGPGVGSGAVGYDD